MATSPPELTSKQGLLLLRACLLLAVLCAAVLMSARMRECAVWLTIRSCIVCSGNVMLWRFESPLRAAAGAGAGAAGDGKSSSGEGAEDSSCVVM